MLTQAAGVTVSGALTDRDITAVCQTVKGFEVSLTEPMGMDSAQVTAGGVSVGSTDLLITWLHRMTLGSADTQYYMASVIGIMVFLVVAILSLVIYNVIPSTKNEEDFS